MAGFQGADVDGLDQTAQSMLKASEAATAVATALQALVVALEAMSWTGFAAALAAYLKGVVIPWVKATAAALKAFGQILQLASSTQKETSGDRPVVTTGSGNYQTPQLPSVSAGDGPRIATIEIHIINGQTGQGSGVQVTTPALPGQVTGTPIQSGVTGGSVPATPVIATPSGSGLSTGATGGGAGGATPPAAPTPVQVGAGGVGSSSGGSSGAGAAPGAGGSSGGWGGSLGVSSRPDGGIDVQGSFHGTIGGDPAGTVTPAVPVSGHTSLGGAVNAGATPGATGGGLNSALLAAPLGLAGLGAAALGGRGAGTTGTAAGAGTGAGSGTAGSGTGTGGTSPVGTGTGIDGGTGAGGTTTPGTTPGAGGPDEAGWRVLATSDSAGHLNLSLVPDTDTVPVVPSALDAGTTGAQQPRIVGWFDGDGDYGFVADDLVFTTPAGQVTIDSLTLQGNVGDDPAVATAVRAWWTQALTEGGTTAAIAAPAPVATPTPIPAALAATL